MAVRADNPRTDLRHDAAGTVNHPQLVTLHVDFHQVERAARPFDNSLERRRLDDTRGWRVVGQQTAAEIFLVEGRSSAAVAHREVEDSDAIRGNVVESEIGGQMLGVLAQGLVAEHAGRGAEELEQDGVVADAGTDVGEAEVAAAGETQRLEPGFLDWFVQVGDAIACRLHVADVAPVEPHAVVEKVDPGHCAPPWHFR